MFRILLKNTNCIFVYQSSNQNPLVFCFITCHFVGRVWSEFIWRVGQFNVNIVNYTAIKFHNNSHTFWMNLSKPAVIGLKINTHYYDTRCSSINTVEDPKHNFSKGNILLIHQWKNIKLLTRTRHVKNYVNIFYTN